jgi:hypothetical protein
MSGGGVKNGPSSAMGFGQETLAAAVCNGQDAPKPVIHRAAPEPHSVIVLTRSLGVDATCFRFCDGHTRHPK